MYYIEGSKGEIIKRVWIDEDDKDLAHIKVFLPTRTNYACVEMLFDYYKPFFSLGKVYHLTDKLTTHSIGGLEALLRYGKEEYKVLRGRRPNGVLWQSEGLYNSVLLVENEILSYELKLTGVGAGGCHFNLGIATKDKTKKIEKMVSAWELNYVAPFLKDIIEHSKKEV